MMSINNALEAYSIIFQSLNDRTSIENESFSGFVTLTPTIIENLNLLLKFELCNSSVDLYEKNERLTTIAIDALEEKHFKYSCKIGITYNWERSGYYIGASWDTLLNSASRILNPIKKAFFTSTSELTSSASLHFKNYLKLSKVCELISQVSLPSTSENSRIIVYGRDIEIKFTLNKNDLNNEFCIKSMERILCEDMHHEAKVALVREALVKLLKSKGSNQRFGYLISHFNAFSSELLLSYQGYVEQYTFDKVRKEYQEKQTEYIQKVNNTYSDIGVKVLAIPAGLWLAIFKIEEASIGSFGFIKNLITFFLCLLCMCYVIFHFASQFSLLKAIKTEYNSLFYRLAQEYEDEAIDINAAKQSINDSAEWAWWKLTLSIFATVVVFIMVIILSFFSIV